MYWVYTINLNHLYWELGMVRNLWDVFGKIWNRLLMGAGWKIHKLQTKNFPDAPGRANSRTFEIVGPSLQQVFLPSSTKSVCVIQWLVVCLSSYFSHLFIFLHRCSSLAAPGTSTQIRDKLLPFIRCQSRLKQLVARWVSVDSSMKDVLKLSACNTLKVWLSMLYCKKYCCHVYRQKLNFAGLDAGTIIRKNKVQSKKHRKACCEPWISRPLSEGPPKNQGFLAWVAFYRLSKKQMVSLIFNLMSTYGIACSTFILIFYHWLSTQNYLQASEGDVFEILGKRIWAPMRFSQERFC